MTEPARRQPLKAVPGGEEPKKKAPVKGRKTTSTKRTTSGKASSGTSPSSPPAQYRAAILSPAPLPTDYGQALADLSANLTMPVWMLCAGITRELPVAFRAISSRIPEDQKIALVIDSLGGDARSAFELARIFTRRCRGFTAVVPEQAMSAATLLTLGADEVLMARDASLGPLDAQIWDTDLEEFTSGLNEVQSLERLRAYALDSVDASMYLLVSRTQKRVETLLPHVLAFVSDSMRPLYETIDVVHYNERARILKVAEEYAVRLLRRKYPERHSHEHEHEPDRARTIASRLVESYPEHGFIIDRDEARSLGLDIMASTPEQDAILERLWRTGRGITAVGPLEVVT